MDLRIYTKSGNDYYIDISAYDYDDIIDSIRDAVSRGDILTLYSDNMNTSHTFEGEEVEYFEIVRDNNEEENESYNIGFEVDEE